MFANLELLYKSAYYSSPLSWQLFFLGFLLVGMKMYVDTCGVLARPSLNIIGKTFHMLFWCLCIMIFCLVYYHCGSVCWTSLLCEN